MHAALPALSWLLIVTDEGRRRIKEIRGPFGKAGAAGKQKITHQAQKCMHTYFIAYNPVLARTFEKANAATQAVHSLSEEEFEMPLVVITVLPFYNISSHVTLCIYLLGLSNTWFWSCLGFKRGQSDY